MLPQETYSITVEGFNKEGRYKETHYFLYLVSSLPLTGKRTDKSSLTSHQADYQPLFQSSVCRFVSRQGKSTLTISLHASIPHISPSTDLLSSKGFLLLWSSQVRLSSSFGTSGFWSREMFLLLICFLRFLFSVFNVPPNKIHGLPKRSLWGFCSASSIKTEQQLLGNLCPQLHKQEF